MDKMSATEDLANFDIFTLIEVFHADNTACFAELSEFLLKVTLGCVIAHYFKQWLQLSFLLSDLRMTFSKIIKMVSSLIMVNLDKVLIFFSSNTVLQQVWSYFSVLLIIIVHLDYYDWVRTLLLRFLNHCSIWPV